VAQPARLSARRRLLSPPAVDLLIPFTALGLNDVVPVLVPVLSAVLQPPKHQRRQGAKDGKGTGDHLAPLFAGDVGDEIDDLLQRPLGLVPGNDRRHGDGGRQDGREHA